jgi:hypothetical protein
MKLSSHPMKLGLDREPETRELARLVHSLARLDLARLDQFFNELSNYFCSFC